jgi:hypothetical protein
VRRACRAGIFAAKCYNKPIGERSQGANMSAVFHAVIDFFLAWHIRRFNVDQPQVNLKKLAEKLVQKMQA